MFSLIFIVRNDEVKYLLSGLYPGIVLAFDRQLPFRGLEQRFHGSVVIERLL